MIFLKVLITGSYYSILLIDQHIFYTDNLHFYLASSNKLHHGNACISGLWNLYLTWRADANNVRRQRFLHGSRYSCVHVLADDVRVQTGRHIFCAANELSRLNLH